MAADKQIKFVFEGDTADLEKALAQVAKQFDKTDKKAKGLGITGAQAAKAAKAGMLAAAAAAAVLAVAFAKTASAALDLAAKADKIAKSAAAVGASAEEWQKVIGAFELGGLTAEQTEMAIKKLGLRIGQVASGAGGPAADAFAKLGLTWQDLEALPLPERMATIADSVKGLGSQTERAAVLNAIFEESGIQMAGAFAKGGDAIRDAAQQIEDAGLITNEVAKQAEDMTDAITLAARAWEGLKTRALAPIIPLITDLATEIGALFIELRKTGAVDDFGRVFVDVFLNVVAPALITFSSLAAKSLGAVNVVAADLAMGLNQLRATGFALTGQWKKAEAATVKMLVAEERRGQAIRDLGALQETANAVSEKAFAILEKIRSGSTSAASATRDLGDAAGDAAAEVSGLGDALVVTVVDEAGSGFRDIASAIDMIAGSLGELFSRAASNIADTITESQEEIASLDDQIANATTARERRMLEGRKRLIEEEVKEQKKAALAMFVAQKVASLSQAAVATALAVITGFAQGGPPLAIAAGIAGGISIAAIAAEPPPSFHSGGMVASGAPDEITARLLRSEAVLSPQGVAAAGGEDGVRDLNRGAGGQPPIVSVLQVRSRVVDAMISDNLRQKQGPLTDALRAARPRALGRHNPFASS